MEISWKYVKPLENKMAVNSFLEKYHVQLPEHLVKWLSAYNGGRPSVKTIRTETGHEYVFKCLLSYNSTDLERAGAVYPELFTGTSLYPIGSDSAGNFVCYDMENKIYVLLNHETDKVERITEAVFLPNLE